MSSTFLTMPTPLLESDHCFAVRQAARHISQLYEKHLAKAHITPNQFNILRSLHFTNGMTMMELAQSMSLDRTTLVRTLRPLFRQCLIESGQNPGSYRGLSLKITDRGAQRFSAASEYWLAAQHEFETQYGEAQALLLRADLFRVARDVPKR